MKRKIISTLVILMIVIAMTNYAYALNNIGMQAIVNDSIIEKNVSDILSAIECQKELFNFDNVEFDKLYVGKKIPAYELLYDGPQIIDDIDYYPILENNEWIATAIVSYDENKVKNVQISTIYAKKYYEKRTGLEEIALLFDDDSVYIITDKEGILVISSTNVVNSRVDYNNNYVEKIRLPKTDFSIKSKIEMQTGSSLLSINAQKYLTVPSVIQISSESCWSAAVKSICGYFGLNKTIDQIYETAGITKYRGARISVARSVLETYGFTCDYKGYSSFWWYQLKNQINYHGPILASATYSDNLSSDNTIAHAIVISGYYEYENIDQLGIISYMDPGTGETAATTVVDDGEFYYTNPVTSESARLIGFVTVME